MSTISSPDLVPLRKISSFLGSIRWIVNDQWKLNMTWFCEWRVINANHSHFGCVPTKKGQRSNLRGLIQGPTVIVYGGVQCCVLFKTVVIWVDHGLVATLVAGDSWRTLILTLCISLAFSIIGIFQSCIFSSLSLLIQIGIHRLWVWVLILLLVSIGYFDYWCLLVLIHFIDLAHLRSHFCWSLVFNSLPSMVGCMQIGFVSQVFRCDSCLLVTCHECGEGSCSLGWFGARMLFSWLRCHGCDLLLYPIQ